MCGNVETRCGNIVTIFLSKLLISSYSHNSREFGFIFCVAIDIGFGADCNTMLVEMESENVMSSARNVISTCHVDIRCATGMYHEYCVNRLNLHLVWHVRGCRITSCICSLRYYI